MNNPSSQTELPFGLLELDAAGTVLRYAPALEQSLKAKADNLLGHNFFTEVLPSPELQDCHARFRLFMEQSQITDKFSTTLLSEQGPIKVQILLARILEKSERGVERLALVRIMPEA